MKINYYPLQDKSEIHKDGVSLTKYRLTRGNKLKTENEAKTKSNQR